MTFPDDQTVDPGKTASWTFNGQLFGVPGGPVTGGQGLWFIGDYRFSMLVDGQPYVADLRLDDEACKLPPVPEPPPTVTTIVVDTTTSTTVPPVVTTTTLPPELPRTGGPWVLVVAAGLGLLTVGGVLVRGGRR